MPAFLMTGIGIMALLVLAFLLIILAIKLANTITEGFKSLTLEEKKAISDIKELAKLKKEIEDAISEKYESLTDFGKKKIKSII